jgi:PAS domain S-box-containing protein
MIERPAGLAVICIPAAIVSVVRDVLGMEITHKRRARSHSAVAQLLLGTVGLALITFICFRIDFGVARTGFAFVILIALVSLLGSFIASVVLSILAAACLNYFFAPPLFEFRIDAADDIVRVVGFLTTALVVSALTTRLKRVERDLGESNTKLERAQQIAHVGWWERDFTTNQLAHSAEVYRILGVRPTDLPQWTGESRNLIHAKLIHPEDRARVVEAVAAALQPGGPRLDIEYRVVRPDGAVRIIHHQADAARDDSGRPLRQFGVLQDITDVRQAERDLRASEARFRTIVDHATDAFFLYREDATVLDVNEEACKSLGYPRDELIGMTAFDYGPDLTPALLERIRDRLRGGQIVSYEGRHRRKDGTVFPVEVRIRELRHEGRMLGLSLVRDITERKRAEDELRASEERFRTLVRFSFDVYWETDAQHRFTRQEFAEGLADAPAAGSEIGKTRWEVPHIEPDAEAWRKHRETLDAHLSFRDFELARPTPDGGKRYVSVSGLPVFDGSGRFIGYRGVGRHITEQKKAEEALRLSEAYLAEAQRLSHTGTTVFDATGPVYFSEESYRMLGFDPLQGLPDRPAVLERIHPDDRDRVDQVFSTAARQKTDYAVEFRIVLPDGTLKHIESIGHPLLRKSAADGNASTV